LLSYNLIISLATFIFEGRKLNRKWSYHGDVKKTEREFQDPYSDQAISFLARYRAYVIASKFFVVDTITFERINRLTSNFAHVETEQK